MRLDPTVGLQSQGRAADHFAQQTRIGKIQLAVFARPGHGRSRDVESRRIAIHPLIAPWSAQST